MVAVKHTWNLMLIMGSSHQESSRKSIYIYITHKSCVIWDTVLPDCFYHLLYWIPEELEPHHEIINVTNFISSYRNSWKPQTPTNQTTFSQSEPSEKSFIIMKQEKQSLTYHHIKHHSTLYQSLCHQHINIQHYIIILSSLYHHYIIM